MLTETALFYYDEREDEDYQAHWLDVGLVMDLIIPGSAQAQPAAVE